MLRTLLSIIILATLSVSITQAQEDTEGNKAANFNPCDIPEYVKLLSYEFVPEVAVALQAPGVEIHNIDRGVGSYHYDSYAISLNMPQSLSPEQLLNEMVSHPNTAVQNADFNDLGTFTPRRHQEQSPRIGDIYDIDIFGPDDGSVMLTELTSDHYIFTTLTTNEKGDHPTPGARIWGFRREPDGSVTFYNWGVSRPADVIISTGLWFYDGQDNFWRAMFTGIGNRVTNAGGSLVSPDAPISSNTWEIAAEAQPNCSQQTSDWNFTWQNQRIDCGPTDIIYYDFTTTITVADENLSRLAIGGAEAQFVRASNGSYTLVNTGYNDLDATVESEFLRFESPTVLVGERTDYFADFNCRVTNPYRIEFLRLAETTGITCILIATETVNLRTGPSTSYDRDGQLLAGRSMRVGRQTTDVDGFIWYQSTEDDTWVRSDIIVALPACRNLPN